MMDLSEDHKQFLHQLEQRLHSFQTFEHRAGLSGHRFKATHSIYNHEEIITAEEVDTLKEIVQSNQLLIYPFCNGFTPSLSVEQIFEPYPGTLQMAHLLTFKEGQLPDGMNHRTFRDLYSSASNLSMAEYIGIRISDKLTDLYY